MISYTEPAEDYHANPATGSGDIRALMRSPMLYQETVRGTYPRETKPMLFGTHTHMALLEPSRFASKVVTEPDMYQPSEGGEEKKWSNIAGVCRKWHRDMKAAGHSVITAKQREDLARMIGTMPRAVADIFAGSKHEVTYRTDMGGLLVQCRVDVEAKDDRYDVKTIKSIESIERAILDRGYHVQDEWYRRVIAAETGARPKSMPFIFVESAAPYRWRIVDMDADYVALAVKAVDQAVHELHARILSGEWGDRDPLRVLVSPPEWAVDQLDDEDLGDNQ